MINKILTLVISFLCIANVNLAHASIVIDDFSHQTSILSTISLNNEAT